MLVAAGSPAAAHLLNMTEARLTLDPDTGSVSLQLQIDLLRTTGSPAAYLALAEDLNNPTHAAMWQALARGIRLEQNTRLIPLRFASAEPPTPFQPDAFEDPFRWPRVWVTLTGEGYSGAEPLRAVFTPEFIFEEPIALTMTDGSRRMSRWLITAQASPAYYGSQYGQAPPTPTLQDRLARVWESLAMGFRHILPDGFDHLMFVLAVLLLCTTARQTVLLVTAFTIGHSLSLAVAGFKLIAVPAAIVEPLILLSISAYGIQALRGEAGRSRHQYWLVAGVGLLHGLGFASAFAELDWVQSPALTLLGFNLGIELAQVLFVLIAFPLVQRYRTRVLKPLALVLTVAPVLLLPRLL